MNQRLPIVFSFVIRHSSFVIRFGTLRAMDLKTILYKIEGGVALLTLNRPESLNALNARLGEDLAAALRAASSDPAVRVIVLCGAGKGFCSGGDLKEMAAGLANPQASTDALVDILRNFHEVVSILQKVDKPVVA